MTLVCAVCTAVKIGTPFEAITVRGGTAVCVHHLLWADDANVISAGYSLPMRGGTITFQTDSDFIDEEDQ